MSKHSPRVDFDIIRPGLTLKKGITSPVYKPSVVELDCILFYVFIRGVAKEGSRGACDPPFVSLF